MGKFTEVAWSSQFHVYFSSFNIMRTTATAKMNV